MCYFHLCQQLFKVPVFCLELYMKKKIEVKVVTVIISIHNKSFLLNNVPTTVFFLVGSHKGMPAVIVKVFRNFTMLRYRTDSPQLN